VLIAVCVVKIISIIERNNANDLVYVLDDEAVLGLHPLIVSVSFGQHRRFVMKRKEADIHNCREKHEVGMTTGTVIVMVGASIQQNWTHEVPKITGRQISNIGIRWNVNFRYHKIQDE
jgi:hypothetical protein